MSPTPGLPLEPLELNEDPRPSGALFDQDEGSALQAPQAPPGVELEPIPMPAVTTSRRARRRRRRQRDQRLLAGTITASLVVVGALVVLAAGLFAGRQVVRQVTGHPSAATAPPPPPPPVLFVEQDPARAAVALAVLAPASGGKGGSILLIDPGTMAEVPALGLQPLSQALALGGSDRLRTSVENLLGVQIGEIDVLDPAGVVGLVGASSTLRVDVPEAVESVAPGGLVDTVFAAGPQDVAAGRVPALLATPGASGDLARVARQEAFFHAWLAQVREDAAGLGTGPPGLRGAVAALAAAQSSVRVLPVSSLGKADDGTQLYQVDLGQAGTVLGEVFPSSHPDPNRPSVQVLNGTGALGVAERVTEKLLPAGVQVKLTDNADRLNYPQTQIVYYDQRRATIAQRVRNALGVGTLVLSRRPIDVVDVTVIVGKDFPNG